MKSRLSVSILLFSVLGLASGVAEADWRFFYAYNQFVPDTDGEAHPKNGRMAVLSDLPEGHFGVIACACYFGNDTNKQKGKMIVTGEAVRADGNESFRMRVKVRKGRGENCVSLPQMGADDLITMNFEFEGFRSLGVRSDSDRDTFVFGSLAVGHMSGPPPTARAARALARQELTRASEEGAQ